MTNKQAYVAAGGIALILIALTLSLPAIGQDTESVDLDPFVKVGRIMQAQQAKIDTLQKSIDSLHDALVYFDERISTIEGKEPNWPPTVPWSSSLQAVLGDSPGWLSATDIDWRAARDKFNALTTAVEKAAFLESLTECTIDDGGRTPKECEKFEVAVYGNGPLEWKWRDEDGRIIGSGDCPGNTDTASIDVPYDIPGNFLELILYCKGDSPCAIVDKPWFVTD